MRSAARPGAIPGGGSTRLASPAYQRENASMAAVSSTGARAFSANDGSELSHSSEEYHSS